MTNFLNDFKDRNIEKLLRYAIIIYSKLIDKNISYKLDSKIVNLDYNETLVMSLILSLWIHDPKFYFDIYMIDIEDLIYELLNKKSVKNLINDISIQTHFDNNIDETINKFSDDFLKFFELIDLNGLNITIEDLVTNLHNSKYFDIVYILSCKHKHENIKKVIELYSGKVDKTIENDSLDGFLEDLEKLESSLIDSLIKTNDAIDTSYKNDTEKIENKQTKMPKIPFIFPPFSNFNPLSDMEDEMGDSKSKLDYRNPISAIMNIEENFIDKYGTNLNELNYEYDPAIGRENLIKNMAVTLETPDMSILIIGPHGVGKSAVVRGLAKGINDGKFLEDKEIIEIDARSLIEGKSAVGSFEKQIGILLQDIQERGNVILFIDEIHQIYDMGLKESNVMNIFKKPISEGKLRIIGATTKNEYEETIKNDRAFIDRCDVYEIGELEKNILKDIILQRIKFLHEYYNGINLPFKNRDTIKFVDYLLQITDKQNRKLNSMSYNPRLVLQLIDTIFATAKVNNHDTVQKEDILYAISNNHKIKSSKYKIPEIYTDDDNINDHKIYSNVIDFNSYKKDITKY